MAPRVRAQGQEPVSMYMINPLTGNNVFNISDHAVNSVLTIDFYVGNVTGLISWQIRLSYNNSAVHFSKAWFPAGNVFQEVIDKGVVPLEEVSSYVESTSNIGSLMIVMTATYPPDSLPQYPVNVTSTGLLCSASFTVAARPTSTRLDFISASTQNPPNLAFVPPYHLPDPITSVQTTNGIYDASGDSAFIYATMSVSESPVLMLLLMAIPTTLVLILAKRRRAAKLKTD
jgi:hypothetical protein